MKYFLALLFLVAGSLSAQAQYKYELKYGTDRYNYDVYGHNYDGIDVVGNVDTNGKFVSGVLFDDDGDEIYFEGEWTGHGEIAGFGDDGEFYDLRVE